MTVVDKLLKEHSLAKEEYLQLLENWQNEETVRRLKEEAVYHRKQYYGNTHASRYRLTVEKIFDCCRNGSELGYQLVEDRGDAVE